MLYGLGAGISRYLTGQVVWSNLFLGLAWMVFLLLGFQYLNEYFYPSNLDMQPKWWRTPFSGSSGAVGSGKLSPQVALWAGFTCITISASFTFLLLQYGELNLPSSVMLGVFILGEFLFSIPPFRLVTSGYGEFAMSILIAGMIPALAYLLQGHEIHRLLIMVSFPLAILFLGMLIALEFPSYASDIKLGNKPVLIRIGWQKGMILHNILILCSFLTYGIALILGMPLSIGWPVFFIFPIGLLQIWMMNRIASGAKPNWSLLILIALSTFSLTLYLLTFSFWIH
jgi:1,4-dihydroxy-2-naphthoate octaprenyltransferase